MKKKLKFLVLFSLIIILVLSFPELLHKNIGDSNSSGKVSSGKIENAFLIPFRGSNFQYFSLTSYFLMNNGYTHSKVYNSVMDSYKALEEELPSQKFYIMECSDKFGGKLMIHKTHQNGLSIDFMSPKKSTTWHPRWNNIGMLHYLLEFNSKGQLEFDKNVEIDFEVMAKHILSLQQSCKKNGIRIKKVILKINLKDNLFATKSGKILKSSGIYFAQSLGKWTDKVHDDHYHIDFELME